MEKKKNLISNRSYRFDCIGFHLSSPSFTPTPNPPQCCFKARAAQMFYFTGLRSLTGKLYNAASLTYGSKPLLMLI